MPDEKDPHRGKVWPPPPQGRRLSLAETLADRDRLARVVVAALVAGDGCTTLWVLDGVVVDVVDRATMRILTIPHLRAQGVVVVDGDVLRLLRLPEAS